MNSSHNHMMMTTTKPGLTDDVSTSMDHHMHIMLSTTVMDHSKMEDMDGMDANSMQAIFRCANLNKRVE